jgi:hypothetical protein
LEPTHWDPVFFCAEAGPAAPRETIVADSTARTPTEVRYRMLRCFILSGFSSRDMAGQSGRMGFRPSDGHSDGDARPLRWWMTF